MFSTDRIFSQNIFYPWLVESAGRCCFLHLTRCISSIGITLFSSRCYFSALLSWIIFAVCKVLRGEVSLVCRWHDHGQQEWSLLRHEERRPRLPSQNHLASTNLPPYPSPKSVLPIILSLKATVHIPETLNSAMLFLLSSSFFGTSCMRKETVCTGRTFRLQGLFWTAQARVSVQGLASAWLR